jgi:hypothetical protein
VRVFRVLLATAVVGSGLVLAGGADAHRADMMTANRAGPIRRDQTTMSQLRTWFGAPTVQKIERVGCVRAVRARWGDDLKVIAWRGKPRRVAAIFVRRHTITSSEHGDLTFHTRRGLEVGDPHRKLRRLYPQAEGITHSGHTHYRLYTARTGGYLMAKVKNDKVIQFEAWPYEFC